MPLADTTLAAELEENGGGLPEEQALRYVTQVLEAMSYAHQQKVVHRDLKPGNILIFSGRARVSDFGLGRDLRSDSSLTAVGQGGGTAGYASPEQIDDFHSADSRSDVYALGLIVLEALVGLSRQASRLPDRYRYVVHRATASKPDDRFADASEMLHEILVLKRPTSLEDPIATGRKLIEGLQLVDADVASRFARLVMGRPRDSRLYFDVVTEASNDLIIALGRFEPRSLKDIVRNLALMLDGPLPVATRHKTALFMQRVFELSGDIEVKEVALGVIADLYIEDRGWFLRKRYSLVAQYAVEHPDLGMILVSCIKRRPLYARALIEVVAALQGGAAFVNDHGL